MTLTGTYRTRGAIRGPEQEFAWIDLMKGVALIWVFLNHCTDQVPGSPFFAYPTELWPPFADRLRQLMPLGVHGVRDFAANVYRYVGWTGGIGVQLFLILSGFGLTWGLLKKHSQAPLPALPFYRRRAERIYPLWWTLHVLAFLPMILAGRLNPDETGYWLSFIGYRATADLLYYLNPAWWYVCLLIQLYLVYPLLWRLLQRKGALWLLLVTFAVAFTIRGLGLFFFTGYLPVWSMGGIFITRLPEFVFGIALAKWCWDSPGTFDRRMRSWSMIALSLGVFGIGILFALDLLGMTFALFLLGAGAFGLLYAPLSRLSASGSSLGRPIRWIGRHSYSMYLVHYFLVWPLVPREPTINIVRISMLIIAAFVMSMAASVAVEWLVAGTTRMGKAAVVKWGKRKFAIVVGLVICLALVTLIAGEVGVRMTDPQEVLGWGERPSLMADPTLGWKLIPGRSTRLRWQSYDYVVAANGLGFPGPAYAPQKKSGTLRILATGDAFTSAEGVNTEQAWPRLLERILGETLTKRNVEVMNFAMTGYGPQQYSTVVEAYAGVYHPDFIVVEMFVNDYQDVLSNVLEASKQIGFELPPPDGWRSVVRLSHLRRYSLDHVMKPLLATVLSRPSSLTGYFLGNFPAFERDGTGASGKARARVAQCLSRIKQVSDSLDADLVVALVPASIQVCDRTQLEYYPHNADITDTSKFDMALPQRLTREITDSLGISYVDLRGVLTKHGTTPMFQPRNMHWTVSGHQVVANEIAGVLLRTEHLRSLEKGR